MEWSCPDHRGERNYVGIDARNAVTNECDILVVGEAPGPEEYRQGYPFVGPSGQLLRTFLRRAGLEPRCTYTNVVKHWPHNGRKTRAPTDEEIDACRQYLHDEIRKLSPRLLIAVGAVAARELGAKGSIGQAEGNLLTPADGPAVMPIYHPAYLLRSAKNPETYRRTENAIRWALELAAWWLTHGDDPAPEYPCLISSTRVQVGPAVAIDTETTGKSLDSSLLLVSIHTDGVTTVCHPDGPVKLDGNPFSGGIYHNALFDLPILMRHGSAPPAVADDTMVLAWLLNEDRLSLKWLARKHLNVVTTDYDGMMADPGWPAKIRYSAQDAVLTARLYELFRRQLNVEEGWWYGNIARPLLPILARATVQGFQVDRPGLKVLLADLWRRRLLLGERLREYGGPDYNPGSTPQTQELLFDSLQLPSVGSTKTGRRSTDETTLMALSTQHVVPSLLLGWRTADKLISTYIKPLLQGDTCHTYYQMTGTETGRLSASGLSRSGLNLQNVPKKIKKYLRARPGYTLVIADYDQIELKIAAALSGDRGMIEDINNGMDLHAKLGCAVWPQYTPETLPKELRSRAKNGNFERLYGGGDYRMAKTLQVPVSKVKVYASLFAGLENWAERTATQARRDGYIKTVFGRKRRLWDGESTSEYLRGKAGREAINTPVQGTVADMVNWAIVKVDPWLSQLGGRVAHQEHDCIIAEVPLGYANDANAALTQAMTEVVPDELKVVPITVTSTVSEAWV